MKRWSDKDLTLLRTLWASDTPADFIAERFSVSIAEIVRQAKHCGLPLAKGLDAAFERMVDLIADAPLNQPVPLADAARHVGLPVGVARDRWKTLTASLGLKRLDHGDQFRVLG